VQPKDVNGNSYRLVPPEEVLARVNRDLIDQELSQLPFITMVYGLLNCRDGRLRLARAGHPHPLYLPREGEPEQWESPGTLLGVFEAEYSARERQLHPGDKLLIFTDGLAHPASGSANPADRLLPSAAPHRDEPIQTLVDRVSQDLLTQLPQSDDFTLLGVELLAG
jgi:sigma-B regulation protein RsbU (phosphoserine phosphatase)